MDSPYLTPDEVKELTGYVTRAAAGRRLDRNGWPYAPTAGGGWPRVLRSTMMRACPAKKWRLPKRGAKPNWSCAA